MRCPVRIMPTPRVDEIPNYRFYLLNHLRTYPNPGRTRTPRLPDLNIVSKSGPCSDLRRTPGTGHAQCGPFISQLGGFYCNWLILWCRSNTSAARRPCWALVPQIGAVKARNLHPRDQGDITIISMSARTARGPSPRAAPT